MKCRMSNFNSKVVVSSLEGEGVNHIGPYNVYRGKVAVKGRFLGDVHGFEMEAP